MTNNIDSLKIKIDTSKYRYASMIIDRFFNDDFYSSSHNDFRSRIEEVCWDNPDIDTNDNNISISLPDEFTVIIDEIADVIANGINCDRKASDYNIYDVFMSRRDLSNHHEQVNVLIESEIKHYNEHNNISYFTKSMSEIYDDIESLVLSFEEQRLIKIEYTEWLDNELIYREFIDNKAYSKYHKKAKKKSKAFTDLIVGVENSRQNEVLNSIKYSEYFRIITIEQWYVLCDLSLYIYEMKRKVDKK